MKVLITGHRGYIGAVLTPLLRSMGHDVTGLDSDLYRRSTFGGHQLEPVPSLTKDVRDVVAADLKGYEAIVHLAGLSTRIPTLVSILLTIGWPRTPLFMRVGKHSRR